MLIGGLMEVLTLGAVLPFLAVIIAPERIFEYPIGVKVSEFLGLKTGSELVLPLTIAFAIAAVVAGGVKLLLLWFNIRLANAAGSDLSVEAYRRTLYQPYQVHVATNTSEIISAIGKVDIVIVILNQVLIFLSAVVMTISIVLALFLAQPGIAATAFIGFGSIYALIIALTRRRLLRNSKVLSHYSTLKIKALQEGLGGIRDVLLDNSQIVYCDLYRQSDLPLRRAQGQNTFIGSSPRSTVEALGIVLITVLAYALSRQSGAGSAAIPVLGLLALGAQRLMPALQQIYGAWAFVRGYQSTMVDLLKLLEQPFPLSVLQPLPPALQMKSGIEFSSVSFRYNQDTPWVLQDASFKILQGTRVAFVGSTGSGKSTTVDLLMGLLEPTKGEILVDGVPLRGEYCRAWQQNIAHVPQQIYLADTTLAENIALANATKGVDIDRVKRAAQQAQIAGFIESRSSGYYEVVGERGIRLSGGQRQRIGIARALYKRASVLVFDEATSALDNATEREVMTAIEGLGRDLTIILIAHRLTTVQGCDLIVEMEQGRVVAQGTYEELLSTSPSFQVMVKGNHE